RCRNVGERKAPLLALGAQRLDADFLRGGFVVADDERVARAAGIRFFHLRFEAATRGVQHDAQARVAQPLRRAPRVRRCRLAYMHDIGVGRLRAGAPAVLQQQYHPLYAHAEAARGRRLATQLRDETVVAAASGDSTLRAQLGGDELEYAAVVVIDAAHQARVD